MIKVVSCFWNAKNYLSTYVKSLKIQTFNDFHVYMIDDLSTDGGYEFAQELIEGDERFTLIKNEEKKFKLKNMDELISQFDDEDIVVEVDADDFLLGNDVLSFINKTYSDKNIWLTNGSFMYSNGNPGFSQECNPDTIRTDAFRFSHLRTWKSFLWKNIPKENFLDENGDYYKSAPDVAYSFPLIELAGKKHYKFINKILYVYNGDTPYNEHKDLSAGGGVSIQNKNADQIRNKPKLTKTKSMNYISCKLMGGLGNQMFQAAHAYCQGLKHNRPVFILSHSWTPLQGKGIENYTKNIFKNFQFGTSHNGFKEVVRNPWEWEYSSVKPFDEKTVFTGYFQSSKNFLGYDDEVRELFSPTTDVIADFFHKYPQLNDSNTVSIHIRRGDYLMNPHIHPSVGLSYIQRALDLVQDYSTIFVFSEDKNWVKENLNFPNMIIVEEDEDYKEIWLMSLCKNNIICNSTFSWWGSFLNKNENKKVIAPSVWFGTGGPSNFKDIYESNWIIINVESKNGILEYVA